MFANRYDEVYGEYRAERLIANRIANKPADVNAREESLQKLLASLAFNSFVPIDSPRALASQARSARLPLINP